MYSGAYGAVELTGDCPKGSYRGIIGVLQYPGGGSLGDVICIVEHMALLNSPVIAQRGPIGVLWGFCSIQGGSLGDVICIVEHMALLNSPVIAQRGPIGVL